MAGKDNNPEEEVPAQKVPAGSSDTDIDEGEKLYEGMAPKTYRWTVDNFPELHKNPEVEKERSEEFEIGNCRWKMLLFPKGNQKGKSDLSLYLEVADKDELPEGWRRDTRMWLHVVNQIDETKSVRQETSKVFSSETVDWGFPQLIPFKKVFEEEGFVVDGRIILEVEICVFRAWIDYGALRNFRLKTRAQTGFVGLYNQGATCYLNAWIQALFHVGAFRRSVYQIETEGEDVKKSIPLALQRLFYRLQFNEDSTETVELTNAFGWGKEEVRTQHDVHELNCLLLDNLERKMKKTKAEGMIEKLFRGEVVNYIDCVNVDCRVERPEHMYGFGLNVQGNKNIYESFDKYMEAELLTEPNQYRTEAHGLQDANKGVSIKRLPPVLLVQLKRWIFDLHRLCNIKVNDKYAFHPVLDLSRFLPEDNKDSGVYHLHAILVHTGGAHGGHYYAYCRPNTGPQWYLFDDSRVSKATEKEALEDNWGGSETHTYKRFGRVFEWTRELSSNAYMLVYVRETEVHDIMNDDATEAIPEHVHEVGEEHLYTTIRLATLKDFKNHQMEKFDLLLPDEVEPTRVKKAATLVEMQEVAAAEFGIPVNRQRVWVFMLRDNYTVRPERCLSQQELQSLTVEKLKRSELFRDSQKMLYIEDALEENPKLIQDFEGPDLMIFFKYFDPAEQKVSFLGHHTFPRDGTKCSDFAPVARKLAGLAHDQPVVFYEEITRRRIDPLDVKATVSENELFLGDIIVVMKSYSKEDAAQFRTPNPRKWSSFIRHRVVVRFRKLDAPHDEEAEFTLTLNNQMSYKTVANEVGQHLKVDPDKVRFTSYNPSADGPRRDPCAVNNTTLREMLSTYYGPQTDLLFYEVLFVSRSQLREMRQVKLNFQNAKGDNAKALQVHVAKGATLNDVFEAMEKQLKVEDLAYNTHKYRLMEVYSHKVFKLHKSSEPVDSLSEYSSYAVEECSPEELDMQEGDALRNVSHYELSHMGNPFPWGQPFQLVIRKGETMASVKERIQKRLEPSKEDNFDKWKFAIVSYGRISHLNDDDIVSDQTFEDYTWIGIEHADNTPLPGHRNTQWKPPAERGLKLAQSQEIDKKDD